MRNPKEVIINGKTLEEILIRHSHWVVVDCDDYEDEMRAYLINADLSNVDLHGADLRKANLDGANLTDADLHAADLDGAILCHANLCNACLRGANLTNAELRDADLDGAILCHANLCNACLRGANLTDADLHAADLFAADLRFVNMYNASLRRTNLSNVNLFEANLTNTILTNANLSGTNLCNAAGDLIEYRKGKILTEDIIGYKKCRNDIIVTLSIPKGAIVFSINGNKCRTNKAKVIGIDGASHAYSIFNSTVKYKVGDEFDIQDFNCEYNAECAEGIHFFMTKEKAEKYNI